MRLRVIGIGSPHGDDAVGLAVARRLQRQGLAGDVEVLARERPGLDLLEDLRDADAAVLVDALRSGAAPGSVRMLRAQEIGHGARLSSHGIGVGAALALAEALGARQPLLRVIGIEVTSLQGGALSAGLEGALEAACAGVREALAELRAELAGTKAGARQGDAAPSAA